MKNHFNLLINWLKCQAKKDFIYKTLILFKNSLLEINKA